MSEFKELIKSFEKSRDYTSNGKNISLSIDSNLLDENPLYRVWKAKSFTDHDIFLHFHLLDYLSETKGETIEEIIDGMVKQYEIVLEPQMVRRKCNEYEKEGLLWKKKQNRTLVYGKTPNFYVPLTKLQRSYLKGILADKKIQLFLTEKEISTLQHELDDVTPLWQPDDIYYFDRFTDHDDYSDLSYRIHFQKILQAIKEREYIEVLYQTPGGNTKQLRKRTCTSPHSQ